MKESICNLVPVDRLIGAPEVFPNVDLLRKYSEKANKKIEATKISLFFPIIYVIWIDKRYEQNNIYSFTCYYYVRSKS